MRVAVCPRPRLCEMPRVKMCRKKVVRRSHIKYVGLQVSTILKCEASEFSIPGTLTALDSRAADYVNELYQDDLPLGWATDSGLKRLNRNSRRHLETSSSYLRNWQKATVRTRAMPVTLECIQAMATVAFIRGRSELSQALLSGFVGLLRVSELLHTTLGHMNFFKKDYMVLTLV